LAERLNAAGQVLHDADLVLCYHNHHTEFRRVGGRTILEALYEHTDPRYVRGEIDTYWVQVGGGDPVTWCRRMTGRLPILHLKDYKLTAENRVTDAEIGHGNLDFRAIVEAADEAGCEWYAVEQDTCPGDPFDSLRRSFEYIKEELCSG
jgi:sugar phosphate isomerase/epimerase